MVELWTIIQSIMAEFFILWTTFFCLFLCLLYLWQNLELFLNTMFLVEELPSPGVSRLLGWFCILLKCPSEYHLNSHSLQLCLNLAFMNAHKECYFNLRTFVMLCENAVLFDGTICILTTSKENKVSCFSFENGLVSSLVSFTIRETWLSVIELHESYQPSEPYSCFKHLPSLFV